MDYDEQRIRAEAASQGIEKTIQVVEEALRIEFPRGITPSESRDIMGAILRSSYGPKKRF